MLLALMVSLTSWAQGISGTVVDDNGDAVIGASVVEKGNPQKVLSPTLMVISPSE